MNINYRALLRLSTTWIWGFISSSCVYLSVGIAPRIGRCTIIMRISWTPIRVVGSIGRLTWELAWSWDSWFWCGVLSLYLKGFKFSLISANKLHFWSIRPIAIEKWPWLSLLLAVFKVFYIIGFVLWSRVHNFFIPWAYMLTTST